MRGLVRCCLARLIGRTYSVEKACPLDERAPVPAFADASIAIALPRHCSVSHMPTISIRPRPLTMSNETKPYDYFDAVSRNIGWVTREEQVALRGKRVAIAGLGGVEIGRAHV